MSYVLLIARLLLGGVFAVAGITKLADLAGSRDALIAFGVPKRFAPALGALLPVAELAVALALIPRSTAIYGAFGALALLLVFIAAMASNLARGRTPDCHCFGQLHSEPVSRKALTRNGLLAAVAAFTLVAGFSDPGPSMVAWLYRLTTFQLAVVAGGAAGLTILAVLSTLLVRAIRQKNDLQQRLASAASSAPGAATSPGTAGRGVGLPAPGFALSGLQGDIVTLDTLRGPGKPVLLIFSDPACGPCSALLPEIGQWQRAHADVLTLAVISRGTAEANQAKVGDHHVTSVLLQHDREVAEAYGVIGTPSAVLIRADGTLGSTTVPGEVEIRQLVAQLVPSGSQAPALAAAPDFTLADITSHAVSLQQFRGKATLLLFWNPGCAYCQQMLHNLKAWEARPLSERTQLLVISTGTIDANRSLGLQSTILLDPSLSTSSLYGVQGTPSAVLVDAEGRLASNVAAGAPSVLALAGQPDVRPEPGANEVMEMTAGGQPRVRLTTLPPDAKPLRMDCVQDELLSDNSMLLYNGCRQTVLTLNPTAALVWEYCDGDHDMQAIAHEVRDVFPGAPDAERDVRDVLDQLLQADMISPAPALAGITSLGMDGAAVS